MGEELDLVIIGAGAAGLSAALYAARARVNAVTIERMGVGGQLINIDRVDDYPGFPSGVAGYELGPQLAEQAMNAGARIDYGEVNAMEPAGTAWVVSGDGLEYQCRAVIIAGGSTLARLDVPGEAEFEGRGVSYCATCDGEFFRDREVAVIGSGDSALDEAEYLSAICSRVHVVHRGTELGAARSLQERARASKRISFVPETIVESIVGDDGVTAIALREQAADRSRSLPISGVFIYVGLKPNSGYLADLLPLDAGGHIPTDIWMATSVAGIYAAGDIRQHSARQIGSSVGDGVTAAIAVERYLRGKRNDG
ncbi:MAG: NAD(P)/FAD-dependent oxidoreductase [Dehalococcoidia bacterium]